MALTQYYYSPSTKGIYSAEVHGTGIPTDRVAITLAQYAQVAAGTHSVTVVGTVASTVSITPQTAGTVNTGIGLATPTSKLHLFVDGNVGASNPAISPLSISTGLGTAEKILIRNDIITSGSNNWYRLSLPQSYATDPVTNGGTVTVSVTWHPLHASNSFCQEYKLTYGTQYTPNASPGYLSITSVQPVYFGKAKQTYSGYPTSPNVDFEYDASGGYLYFNISGANASYNREKSIKVVVNGKTVSEPQLIQTTTPTGTNKLSKISEIPGGRYSTSIFKEIPVSNPSYLYQYLKLFRHHTGINGADTGGATTHFAGTISAIRSNDLGVTTSSYISVSRTYHGYFLFSQTCNHGKPYELRNITDETGEIWLCLRCPQSNPGVHLFTVNGSFTDFANDHTQYNQLPFEAMIGGAGTATTFGADISTPITEGTALNNVVYSSVQTDAPAIFKRDVYANENLILNGTGNIKCSTTKQGMIGVYDPQKTQAIWAMGAAYTLGTDPSSTAYGNHYGLAWSYNPDYNGVPGNNPQSKAGLSHQLLIQLGGVTQTAIGRGIWTIGTVTAPIANITTVNITTANVDTLNINPAGTGIYLPASGNAQQIQFTSGGSPTLPNSLQSPGVAALPYSIYREGGTWDTPYPDLVISYHTGIKLIAHQNYGGTRFYSSHVAGLQTDTNILLSVGNGDNHVRVGPSSNLIVPTSLTLGTSFAWDGQWPQCVMTHYADYTLYQPNYQITDAQLQTAYSQGGRIAVLDTTITPRRASSKINVRVSLSCEHGTADGVMRLYRRVVSTGVITEIGAHNWAGMPANTTAIPYGGNRTQYYGHKSMVYDANNATTLDTQAIDFLDTPNTTVPIMYFIVFYTANNTHPIAINRTYNDRSNYYNSWNYEYGTSQMILQEFFA